MNDVFHPEFKLEKLVNYLIKKIAKLHNEGAIVQAQPLGMMRLALDGQKNADNGMFLHFWFADLPRSIDIPVLHTHVFHLKSRIIQGHIQDTTYRVISDATGSYQLVEAECTQNSCSVLGNLRRVRMEIDNIQELSAGEVYEVEKGRFHVTSFPQKNQTAITIIQKSAVDNTNPILALPYGAKLTNKSFDRMQLDQEFAWEKITSSLQEVANQL